MKELKALCLVAMVNLCATASGMESAHEGMVLSATGEVPHKPLKLWTPGGDILYQTNITTLLTSEVDITHGRGIIIVEPNGEAMIVVPNCEAMLEYRTSKKNTINELKKFETEGKVKKIRDTVCAKREKKSWMEQVIECFENEETEKESGLKSLTDKLNKIGLNSEEEQSEIIREFKARPDGWIIYPPKPVYATTELYKWATNLGNKIEELEKAEKTQKIKQADAEHGCKLIER